VQQKQQPLVSICIPTYNGIAFLGSALESALAQTYSHIEIVVCDDGSTDGTQKMLERYRQTHSCIRIIRRDGNGGMVENWNLCIKEAKGEWIKFLFQDDLLRADCVAEMVEACTKHGAEVALCSRDFIIDKDAMPHLQRFFGGEIVKPEHLFGSQTVFINPQQLAGKIKGHLLQNVLGEPPCYFFKKTVTEESGLFKTNMTQLVDYEFILRLSMLKGFVFIAKPLVQFRVHAASQSSANNKLDKQSLAKKIRANAGDSMILLREYQINPVFSFIKDQVGTELLSDYIRHIYYSGCKHNGVAVMNDALQDIRERYAELVFEYSFFKYIYYRRRIKGWERQFRQLKRQDD
jgi:glycosyltransferase involved in cell wall biosynthesis